MRILVTGANGFVGRHLCRHLREQGDEVVEAHGPVADPGGIPMQVTDPASVRSVVAQAHPQVAIHLAGFSSVAKSHEDPAQAFAVNSLGAVHLLTALRDRAPRARVLLIGSAEMYGRIPDGIRATEELPLKPLSPYAASKAAAEVAGLQFHRAYGLEVIALRPFNHIGAGQAAHFVVPSFARQIASVRRQRSGAVKTGDLTAVRDFSHVLDVVEAYRLVATRGEPGEVYNVCSGEGRNIRDLLDEMLKMSGVDAPIETDPSLLRPVELPSLIGDPTKLLRLGWNPRRSVTEALREALQEAEAA